MLNTLVNTCSHLSNASRAHLGLTSLPSTNLNLALALALHRAGYLSSVTRGGPAPPPLLTPTTNTSPSASSDEGAADEATITQSNISTRRLWLGLKYWRQEPVLRKLSAVSTPSKPVHIPVRGLDEVCRGFGHVVRRNGRTVAHVGGLVSPGDCLFVRTDVGVLEAREALERKRGGLVLARAE